MIDLPEMVLQRVGLFVPVLLSLTVHEWAHAAMASHLGDDTARRMGRMSLDPTVHIDPVGTLLLPLLGVPFGWAKPVPVDPLRFDRSRVSMRAGLLVTAAAGPASNLVLALGAGLLLALIGVLDLGGSALGAALGWFLSTMVMINVLLALFNLLPIPPLDGSRVADGLMPDSLRPMWGLVQRYRFVFLALVLIVPGVLLGGLLDQFLFGLLGFLGR